MLKNKRLLLVSLLFALLAGCFLGLKLHKKNEFLFDLLIKVLQFLVTAVFLYLAFALIRENVYMDISIVVIITLLGMEMVEFYLYLITYLNSKGLWKSSMLHS